VCQVGDGGVFEDGAQGEFEVEGIADAGDELGGEQGMAAQFEEAVHDADLFEAEQVLADADQLLFGGVAWGEILGLKHLAAGIWGGQGLAVDFAGWGEGEGVEGDEEVGQHVLRQLGAQVRAQLVGVGCGLVGVGGEVGDELLVAWEV